VVLGGGAQGLRTSAVGTNRYAYAGNDPINRSDPSGHEFDPDSRGGVPAGEGGTSGPDGDASAPGGGIRPDRDDVALFAQSPRTYRTRVTLEEIRNPLRRIYELAARRLERDRVTDGYARAKSL